MRQRRWVELIGDFDMEIVYHEGKANVVADALSRKYVHALCTTMSRVRLHEEVEKMGNSMIKEGDTIGDLTIEPELYAEIWENQAGDSRVTQWKEAVGDTVEGDVGKRFSVASDGSLRFDGRLCVPDNTWSKAELAKAYVKYVVKLHGVPKDISSDRDSRFISKFWQELQSLMGTQLKMSTAFHLATDDQTERTIQTLEDMLRACLRKYMSDPTHLLEPGHVEIDEQLSYVEEP
ncbi:uncharacterized protein LOC141651395 [Silene latifolia]|uniref:uncharacterized protein LOC141651395 n=1 Tax=Silene latifolia TaxID=37657 RepID=UPI003D776825